MGPISHATPPKRGYGVLPVARAAKKRRLIFANSDGAFHCGLVTSASLLMASVVSLARR
jgi:hypothetical protein